jgi:hypothetical protein
MVVDRILLAHVCPRGVLDFPLAGKFKNTRLRCVLLPTARTAARFERELSMDTRLTGTFLYRLTIGLRGFKLGLIFSNT